MITTENIPQFINKIKKEFPFKIDKIVDCSEVNKYSNSNYIWKIKLLSNRKNKIIFLKQFRKYNKRALQKGKKIYVDPKRAEIEVKFIKLLQDLWGKKYVPGIFYYDFKEHVIIMSDVSKGKKILIEEFKKGQIYSELGRLFGRLFGELHGKTYKNTRNFTSGLKWNSLSLKFFNNHLSFGIRKYISNSRVDKFYKEVNKAPFSIIWGDASYRNIFVNKENFSLIDFDFAFNYDPALDCGMLLAHWAFMMLKNNSRIKKQSEKFINDFLKNYKRQLKASKISNGNIDNIIGRIFKWMGIYLVSRTDGKSGSYFKDWSKWEKKIRENGIALFKGEDNDIIRSIKI